MFRSRNFVAILKRGWKVCGTVKLGILDWDFCCKALWPLLRCLKDNLMSASGPGKKISTSGHQKKTSKKIIHGPGGWWISGETQLCFSLFLVVHIPVLLDSYPSPSDFVNSRFFRLESLFLLLDLSTVANPPKNAVRGAETEAPRVKHLPSGVDRRRFYQ